jgi:hypothetical protein
MASKDLMKQALIDKIQDKVIICTLDINELTEHEIDATAIGFVQYLLAISNSPL